LRIVACTDQGWLALDPPDEFEVVEQKQAR